MMPHTAHPPDLPPPCVLSQVVVMQTNYMGTALFICYMAAAAYYFYVRATKTLDIGYVWWAAQQHSVLSCLPRCLCACVFSCLAAPVACCTLTAKITITVLGSAARHASRPQPPLCTALPARTRCRSKAPTPKP
jgi:hypothetical protein